MIRNQIPWKKDVLDRADRHDRADSVGFGS